jgi:hypothetical protein
VIRYLWSEARPGETILAQYEHFPLMYYTDLRVVRWDEAGSLEALPEWVFFHGLRRQPLDPSVRSALHRYRRVPLEAREIPWENIPEPYWHWFRTSRQGPRVRLYRLERGGTSEYGTGTSRGPQSSGDR